MSITWLRCCSGQNSLLLAAGPIPVAFSRSFLSLPPFPISLLCGALGGTLIVNVSLLLPLDIVTGVGSCVVAGEEGLDEFVMSVGPWRIDEGMRRQIDNVFRLGRAGSAVTGTLSGMPPSYSSESAFPGGMNDGAMKANSKRARCALYGVVESLFFFSRSRTAFRKCHQHSWIFADHTSRSVLISAMSLSVCANTGIIPYLSRKHATHAIKAFLRFPISIAVAVDSKQYDRGNPELSYSPMTLYSSRFRELVSSGKDQH